MQKKQTPLNFSDYALVYGSKACGLMAGYLTIEEGLLEAVVAAANGLLLSTVLLLAGLILIKQPPAIIARLLNNEPIDDIVKKPSQQVDRTKADE
jgi:hypothetical protein